MKKIVFCLLTLVSASAAFAQLAPDQNPDYEVSRSRYMAAKDSLLSTQSTTVQNTYKAYDWMQLRQERKDIRFQNRQQRRLNRSMGMGYFDYYDVYPYNSYYNNYNNYYNRNRYNYNRYPYRSYNNYRPDFSDILFWLVF